VDLTQRLSLRRNALSGAAFFLIAFALYNSTHVASLFLDDSGETICIAQGLGIGHPPGYPLHTLLAHAFAWAWPFGGPGDAVNLLAAACAAAAVSLAALLGLAWARSDRLSGPHAWAAALPLLIMALGPVWWHNALGAKGGIYHLNNLLSVGLLSLLASPGPLGDRRVRGFWLLLGLALAHHYMSQLPLLPAYAWLLWQGRRQSPWSGAWLLLPGLALYLYLPLRSACGPDLNWGAIHGWHDFWFFFLREQYSGSELTRSAATSLAQLAHALRLQGLEGGLALTPLAVAGLWMGRQRRLEQALGLGWLSALLAVTFYLNLNQDRLDLMQPYLFPAYLCQALLASRALARLAERWGRGTMAGSLILALLVPTMAWTRWAALDLSGYHAAEDSARGLLLGLPRDSLLLAQGDAQIFPLWYLQRARHERPDVAVVGLAVLPMDWVRQDLVQHHPDLHQPQVHGPIGTESIPALTRAYLELNPQRPPYAGFNRFDTEMGPWRLRSAGAAFQCLSSPAGPQDRALARRILMARPLRGLLDRPQDPRTLKLVTGDFAIHFNALGVDAEEAGAFEEALAFYQDAARIQPEDPDYPFNQGNALNSLHRLQEAVGAYQRSVALDPAYVAGWFNLGVTQSQLGQLNEARQALSRVLELQPENVQVRQWLESHGAPRP
jgi:tetratricopeptide (TPR) repeat protein